MISLSSIRTLFTEAWRTAASEPTLLVPGIFISAIALFEQSYVWKIFSNSSLEELSHTPIHSLAFLSTLIIATAIIKTLAESQIFIAAAARVLHQPSLLAPSCRFKNALRYLTIEIICSSFILISAVLLFPILTLKQPSILLSILAVISALVFIYIVLLLSILKHMLFGYGTLSSLTPLSAFNLSVRLLSRYLNQSIVFLLILTGILSLFTFLQNLVILQGAFLYSRAAGLFIETLSYTAALLLGTFIALFSTVIWVHFFLLLTNRRREERVEPIILHEEIPETPPVA